jgi:hypothetical protein
MIRGGPGDGLGGQLHLDRPHLPGVGTSGDAGLVDLRVRDVLAATGGRMVGAQRDPGIKRGGDERVPERVGCDGLGDPGAAGDFADDPPGAVPSSLRPSTARNTGPPVRSLMARSIARAVRGASGMVTTLPP